MGADRELIQIVGAALAEAERKAGFWLACRPGCTPCCMGPFPITTADALRLRNGLAALERNRAEGVRQRARASVARIERDYPGGTLETILQDDEAAAEEPC